MSDLQDVLDAINVEEWLDFEGIEYRRGHQLNLRECPFCGDDRHKVYMRVDDGRGVCFHGECQQGFNLFSFARAHYQVDSRQTIERLRAFSGMPARPVSRISASSTSTDENWSLPRNVALPTTDGKTHPFLTQRKITLSSTRMFDLRYCHEGVHRYEDLDGIGRRQDFSHRILIPVRDLDGSLQTFQGRDVTGAAEQRYLFPRMRPGTGRFLYGGHLLRDQTHLVIGEGPFDTIAIHQSIEDLREFRDMAAIGSFGLSIGHGGEDANDQLARLRQVRRRGVNTLTFLWDGEQGALKQALAMGKLLRDDGFIVRVGLLPPDHDPNECSTEIVRQAIREARTLSDATIIEWTLMSPYA